MAESLHAKEHKPWLPLPEHLFLRALDCAIPVVEIYRQVPPLGQDET